MSADNTTELPELLPSAAIDLLVLDFLAAGWFGLLAIESERQRFLATTSMTPVHIVAGASFSPPPVTGGVA